MGYVQGMSLVVQQQDVYPVIWMGRHGCTPVLSKNVVSVAVLGCDLIGFAHLFTWSMYGLYWSLRYRARNNGSVSI